MHLSSHYIFVVFCLILFVQSGCKKTPPDGQYCAKVQFIHPETKRNMTLTLVAEVADNEVTSFSFPEGQYDQSSLRKVKIPKDGIFTVMSTHGTMYKVEMLGGIDKCLKAKNMVQCKGFTKDGKRCQRFTENKNGLCWQHKNQK